MEMRNLIIVLAVFLVGLVIAPAAQAAVLFDDDLESGINTTDATAANHWRPYDSGSIPGTTTAASHSGTTSAIELDWTKNGLRANIPFGTATKSYESWVYREFAAAETLFRFKYALGNNSTSGGWNPLAGLRLDSRAATAHTNPQNFHYQSG